jgi:hypothetical protein
MTILSLQQTEGVLRLTNHPGFGFGHRVREGFWWQDALTAAVGKAARLLGIAGHALAAAMVAEKFEMLR